jgi:cytochrome b561
MSNNRWSLSTRFLHLGLVITVSTQLIVSLVMQPPGDHEESASALAKLAYEIHESVGLAALAVVVLHWLASLVQSGGKNLSHLFPWGASGRAEIKADIATLKQGALPEGGARGGLPGFVHGLGLLAVTGMVITGGVLFLYWPEQGDIPEWVDQIGEVHEVIATLVWTYWGSHIALAVLHGLAGHTEVRDIFKLSRP